MQGRKHQIARLQGDFYRDAFRKLWRWVFYSLMIMFLLLAAIVYFLLIEPPLHFYANTSDGKILKMPTPKIGGETHAS